MPSITGREFSRRAVLAGLPAGALVLLGACGGDDDGPRKPTPKPGTATAATPVAGAALYYPPATGEWERADPVRTGWSPKGLAEVVDLAKNNNSGTFMMLAGGRVLVEEYFLGVTATARFDVASVQKSFTSTLMGLARDRGLLEFDDAVSKYLATGWSNASPADEGRITLRHLLTHSSGLDPKTLKKETEPGRRFNYNNATYQKLRAVLEKVAGTDINRIARAGFFDAIAIGGAWEPREGEKDPTGATLWGLHLSAREMARFGLFAQRAGAWAGTQVTKPGWFAEAWTPSAVKADYGLLWWLQGRGSLAKKGAPGDLVSALGAGDQKIYVIPSLDLVATRQGKAAGKATENESDFDAAMIKAILAARA